MTSKIQIIGDISKKSRYQEAKEFSEQLNREAKEKEKIRKLKELLGDNRLNKKISSLEQEIENINNRLDTLIDYAISVRQRYKSESMTHGEIMEYEKEIGKDAKEISLLKKKRSKLYDELEPFKEAREYV